MESEKVKELAESLKKQGLAASMFEAMEKAKRIMGEEGKVEEQKEKPEQEQKTKVEDKEGLNNDVKRFNKPDYDVLGEELTVDELMKEAGVDPEEVKREEKGEIAEEEKKPEERMESEEEQ